MNSYVFSNHCTIFILFKELNLHVGELITPNVVMNRIASLLIKNLLKERGHPHHCHATTFVTILQSLTSYAYFISGHYQSNTMDAQEQLR
jgi:hypothetical protein